MDIEYKLYKITRIDQEEETLIVAEDFNDIMCDVNKMCEQNQDLKLKKVEMIFDFVYISDGIHKRIVENK